MNDLGSDITRAGCYALGCLIAVLLVLAALLVALIRHFAVSA